MQWIRTFLCLSIFFSQMVFGGECEVYFSPEDNLASHLIEKIDLEEKGVLVAIYCMTHKGVVDALVRAKKRGVGVEIIVDPFSLRSKMVVAKLNASKLDYRVFDVDLLIDQAEGRAKRSSLQRALMHNKFCLFGDDVVWTGSFNFTYDATQVHRENVVVVHNRLIADKYRTTFYKIKREQARSYEDYLKAHPPKEKNVLDALYRR